MLSLTGVVLAASMVVGQTVVEVPKEILTEIEFMEGHWKSDVTMDGDKINGESKREWGPGKYCLVEQWTSDRLSAVGIFGWDPASNELVEVWHGANGQRIENRYKVRPGGVWEGIGKVHWADGRIEESTIRLEKTGPDSFTFTAKSKDGQFVENSRRVKK